jgi:hypothetical protein
MTNVRHGKAVVSEVGLRTIVGVSAEVVGVTGVVGTRLEAWGAIGARFGFWVSPHTGVGFADSELTGLDDWMLGGYNSGNSGNDSGVVSVELEVGHVSALLGRVIVMLSSCSF